MNGKSENQVLALDVEGIDEIVKVFPYVRTVVRAIGWIQAQRLKGFLRALERNLSDDPTAARVRLEEVLSDPKAVELLAEYAEAVIRTSSRIANAALALLYADQQDVHYSRQFKARAAAALRGIDDRAIRFFLALTSGRDPATVDSDAPYPTYFLRDLVEKIPAISTLEAAAEGRFQVVFELQRRGLLLPDWSSGGFGGGESGFGFGADAMSYRDLLTAATDALDSSTVPNSEAV